MVIIVISSDDDLFFDCGIEMVSSVKFCRKSNFSVRWPLSIAYRGVKMNDNKVEEQI